MRFNRNLKNQMPRSYPSGYQAPSTLLFNTDQAQLLIGDSEPQAIQSLNETLPAQLELVVNFEAVYCEGRQVKVQIDDREPVQLYQGRPMVLERLDFKVVQTPELAECALECAGEWSLTFGCQAKGFDYQSMQGQQDVWDYGGSYEPGCDLQLIQPQFFSLIGSGDQTEIKVSSLALWHSHGITPPVAAVRDDRLITFQGQGPYKNLQEFLEGGGLQVNLTYDGDIMQTYTSLTGRRLQEQQLSIKFVKEEEKVI